MEKETAVSRSSKRSSKKKRNYILIAVIVLLLFVVTAGASFLAFSLLYPSNKKHEPAQQAKPMMSLKDKMTVMVMGVDRRSDDVGRSDTLMVAAIDPKKERAALISVPRDTRVKISGHGYDKINHAYAYGGHRLTQRSVEGLLGVPMEHYVLIDIAAFERIIDALGGVEIDVEKRMYYEDPWDDDGGLVIDLQKGLQHMDGKTAIQYVRYRDEEGDIGRIGRQQKFMRAVVDKMATPSIVLKLPKIVREISSAVETDLSLNDMLSLVNIVGDVKKKGIKMDMVPGKPAYISEVSYWLPDVKGLRHMVAEILEVKVDERLVETMNQEADEYESSIPKEMVIVNDTKSIPDKIRNSDEKDDVKKKRRKTDTADKKDNDADKAVIEEEKPTVNKRQSEEKATVKTEDAAKDTPPESVPESAPSAPKAEDTSDALTPAAPNLSGRK